MSETIDTRVAVLERIAANTERLLEKLDSSMVRMDERWDARMTRLEDRQRSDLNWLLGLGISATAALLAADGALFGLIAHGFHWL